MPRRGAGPRRGNVGMIDYSPRSSFWKDCGGFSTTGENPFFSLNPGYQLVLESEEEKAVITVLGNPLKTVQYKVDGEKIETRVVEERAYELEIDEETWDMEEKLVEISLNWFAICNRTNAVFLLWGMVP